MVVLGRRWLATLIALLGVIGALVVAAPASYASGRFCNRDVCITSHDDGLYLGGLEVGVWEGPRPGSTNVHVWSSDGRYNVYYQNLQGSYMRTLVHWVFPRRWFLSGARVCAEASIDGRKVGLPCFTMRA
jgi:hypothetical protein